MKTGINKKERLVIEVTLQRVRADRAQNFRGQVLQLPLGSNPSFFQKAGDPQDLSLVYALRAKPAANVLQAANNRGPAACTLLLALRRGLLALPRNTLPRPSGVTRA